MKFVISSRRDYEFARDFTREHALEQESVGNFLAGISQGLLRALATSANCLVDPQDLAQWMLADDVNARLGLQIHKFIWEPQVKGV